jgi:CubicO group peptidase (beta-lactamase class C family)
MVTIRSCFRVYLVSALLGGALLGACDSDVSPVGDDPLALDGPSGEARRALRPPCAELDQQLADAFDVAATDPTITTEPNATLLLEAADGRRFTHRVGVSTENTRYASASTSKLVTAVVILDLVDQGVLSLDSTAHDLIPFWTGETAVTLRDLLSFRSGFDKEPDCIGEDGNFRDCVKQIYDTNLHAPQRPASGTRFNYASTHMQIAGLMAINATNRLHGTHKTWSDLFADWKTSTGLFPHGVYDQPSVDNPRLSGGMHWTGEEYLALLRALQRGTVLTPASRAALFANQRGEASVKYSPVVLAVHEDWAYGLGNWLECPTATGDQSFNCEAGYRNSSPGAFGAYPFIDFQHHYVGMLARQGDKSSFHEGLATFRAVEEQATAWAEHRCRP